VTNLAPSNVRSSSRGGHHAEDISLCPCRQSNVYGPTLQAMLAFITCSNGNNSFLHSYVLRNTEISRLGFAARAESPPQK
jgi:hypothetical protein